MNPFLEILDSLVESFSAILGRPRAVKPTRAEEQERPADLPGSEPEPPAEEEPCRGSDRRMPLKTPEPEITPEEDEAPAEVDDDRPADLPPAEEEQPAETAEEPLETEPVKSKPRRAPPEEVETPRSSPSRASRTVSAAGTGGAQGDADPLRPAGTFRQGQAPERRAGWARPGGSAARVHLRPARVQRWVRPLPGGRAGQYRPPAGEIRWVPVFPRSLHAVLADRFGLSHAGFDGLRQDLRGSGYLQEGQ